MNNMDEESSSLLNKTCIVIRPLKVLHTVPQVKRIIMGKLVGKCFSVTREFMFGLKNKFGLSRTSVAYLF